MAGRTIEARLVISGEDRASAAIASVVKTVRQLEDAAKVSKPLQEVAKSLLQVEQAEKAVNAAMSARSGFTTAEAGLKATRGAATAAAQALNEARAARAAFDGVKAAKGSEQAKQIEAATRAVRDAGTAYRKAEGDVRRATAAIAAQSATLQHAEAAATKLGADLGNLEAHQQRLRASTEAATGAMRAQIRIEDAAARAAAHHAREQAESARHYRQHGAIGTAAAAASGGLGVHSVLHVAGHAWKAGAEVQSNRVDMAKAGIGSDERQHITDESLKLAAKYKNVTQAGVMELWKEMRSVMTDPHEVDHVIDPMVRAKSLLDAHDKTGTASHGLNLLVKGAENIGAAKDPVRFVGLLDGYVKAMQVMGKTITPEGIYEMQKYSKAAGASWSDRFIMTTSASLGQEMGGSTAGNSIQMAQKQIANGMQNLHTKAKEFARVGLIDPKNLDYLKTGEVKGTKAGVKHAVKGDELAATDLDRWVYEIMLPALEANGIKSEADKKAWISKSFTGTGADVITKLMIQRESFEAHARMYGSATGLDGQKLNASDPTAALGSLSKSLETFAGVLTTPAMKDAAHGLDYVAGKIGEFSVALEAFNKAHPTLAKAEGATALGVGVAGAGAASVFAYKMVTGFGLPSAAAELTVAAKMLQGAAIEKGAAPAAAAAAFGLGGVMIAGGAVGGAYLDSSETTQGGMGAAAITGGESTGQRLIRENREMQERQKTLAGQAEELTQRLEIERGVYGRLKEAYGTEKGNPAEAKQADAAARITRWEEELTALEAKIKALGNMPIPPPRPPDFTDLKVKAGEAGTEAGTKAGEGVRSGIETKAPEVVEQGQTLFQRIKELFGQGINLPINFTPGEGMGGGGGGGGLIQKASFGGSDGLGTMVRHSSLGGGGGTALGSLGLGRSGESGGGTASDSVESGSDYTASIGGKTYRAAYGAGGRERVGSWMSMLQRPLDAGGLGMEPDKARAMVAMMQGESGINLNPGAIGDHGTAFGTGQWRLDRARALMGVARDMGLHWTDPRAQQQHFRNEMLGRYRGVYDAIQRAPSGDHALAIGIDRFENPAKKALAYRFRHPYLQALRRDRNRPTVPADEPRLVKGLDGKEGLDLGNGTMRMPTGEIRSIPSKSSLTIPEPPTGGFGGGSGGIGKHVEAFGQHVDRLADMGFDGNIQVSLSGSGSRQARVTGLSAKGRGGMSADMGISMPGAKESDSDWN